MQIRLLGVEEVEWLPERDVYCSEHFGLLSAYKLLVSDLKKFEQTVIEV